MADRGTPHKAALEWPRLAALANEERWDEPVLVLPESWEMPAGAFKKAGGPT